MRTRMVMGSKVVKLAVVSSVAGTALSRLFSTIICKLSVVEYSKMRTRIVVGSNVVKLAVVSSIGGSAFSRRFSTTICKLSNGASHGFRVSTMRRTTEPRTAAMQ